ncbi:hypothetical protein C0995_002443 [Termitomyces sp. Mi166|nr:hypothetical protein C0995_002443 [Termitomyces sp. Mi166\
MDLSQQIIDQHKMKKRLGRLANAGFKLADTANNNLVMSLKACHAIYLKETDFEPEIAQPPSLTPFRLGNELDSPFRDPKENPWKTAAVSSLQSSASK